MRLFVTSARFLVNAKTNYIQINRNCLEWRNFASKSEIMAGGSKSLEQVVNELEAFAPIRFAESWDNVGLLIEPNTPRQIQTIFLTNDLTESVLKEAINKKSDLIISYHPPIFAPLKRITQSNWKERLISICLENRIALYSPHTAWDYCKNGVGDWLASSLPHIDCVPLQIKPGEVWGIGRLLTLQDGIILKVAIEKVKENTGLKDVRVAIGKDSSLGTVIKTVAICPGSGGSLFKGVEADLFLTGEMSHHEILDATQKNTSVILCNHSNSERGFLKQFARIIEESLDGSDIDVILSEIDADPLQTI